MAEEIKRMRYYDGLFMKQEDFTLDQDYSLRMRRLHNRHLHGNGIVWGLEIEQGPAAGEILVNKGMAIDRFFDSKFSEETGREIIVTTEKVVDLSSHGTADVYVWIEHDEIQADIVAEKGAEPIHFQETFTIGHDIAKPPNINQQLILAKVTVTAGVVGAIVTEEGGESLRIPIVTEPDPIVVPVPTPTPTPTPTGDSQISVTAWEEYDLTITATGATNPTKANNPDIDKAHWRRIGDSMEIVYTYKQSTDKTGATPGDGTYLFSLPPGFTIDSTKMSFGPTATEGVCGTASVHHLFNNSNLGFAQAYNATNIAMVVEANPFNEFVGTTAYQLNTTDDEMYSFRATVPIAEWTVGTVGSFNNVEFAFNSDTANSDDTTSFAYGEIGSLVPVVNGAAVTKRVQFSKAFKQYKIEIQTNGTGPWIELGSTRFTYHTIEKGDGSVINYDYGIYAESQSETEINVEFMPIPWRHGNAVGTWTNENSNGTRWRVVGSDNPLFVEAKSESFEQVSVTSWQPYDLEIRGASSNPSKATSPLVDKAFWRRVGDSMEITYTYEHTNSAGATAGSGDYTFSLPPGFQIDTAKSHVGASARGTVCGTSSVHQPGSNLREGFVYCYDTTSLGFFVDNGSSLSPLHQATFPLTTNPLTYSFRATVPIVGWTSGTVGSFNKIEYAFNSDIGGSNNTSSFAFGEDGGLVPTDGAGWVVKRIQLSRAFNHVELEVKPNGAAWTSLGSSPYAQNESVSSSYGMYLLPVTGSDTEYEVYFSSAGTHKGSLGIQSWANEQANGTRYRVVGCDNPLFVEGSGGQSEVSITSWEKYDLRITSLGGGVQKSPSPDIDHAVWRRVGDSMEILYNYAHTTPGVNGTGHYLFSLPDGFTIDETKLQFTVTDELGTVGTSSIYDNTYGTVKAFDNTNLVLYIGSDTLAPQFADGGNVGRLGHTPMYMSFRATVPIAEWTTGTVGSFNRVEYAFNSDDTDGDDSTSNAYGEGGGLVPAVTVARKKRVKFSKAFKQYKLEVQVNGVGPWLDLATAGFDQIETSGHRGMAAEPISATEFDVHFAAAGIYSPAGTNSTWPAINAAGTRWRMVGTDNPLFVESEQLISVTSWTQFDLDITASVTNPNKANTPVSDNARWRRVGDSMEIVYTYEHTDATGATAGDGAYQFRLPAGYSIDGSKIQIGTQAGNGVCGSFSVHQNGVGFKTGIVYCYDSTGFATIIDNDTEDVPVSNARYPLSTNPIMYSFRATVPIAEWTTHTQGSYNRVEYAFNSDTANADDSTSFAWGEGGGLVPTVSSSSKNKRVKFSRAFKHYQIEISESQSGAWYAASDNMDGNGTRHGIRLFPISSSEFDVRFYLGGTSAGPTWATANSAGDRWRVVGCDNPLFVEAQNTEVSPIGTINAWNKSMPSTPSLPAGWLECNGQLVEDVESPYNGQTMPNLNNAPADPTGGATNTYSKGVFLRGDTTSGVLEEDSMQGHRHTELNALVHPVGSGGTSAPAAGGAYQDDSTYIGDPKSDGVNGTPRTATETRPVNFSVVWIMRIK